MGVHNWNRGNKWVYMIGRGAINEYRLGKGTINDCRLNKKERIF